MPLHLPVRLFDFKTACYLLFCLNISLAFAEDPGPISTERPSFSASPIALPTGYWQIEAGYQFTRDKDDASFKQHKPLMLIRYGFHEKLELQLGNINYVWQQIDALEENGPQDPSLGLKWQVNSADSVVPVGLYGAVSLPVGSSSFSSGHYDPSMDVLWTYSSALEWFGTARLAHSNGFFTFDNAIGISFAFPGNSGSFVEYLGTFHEDDNLISAHNLNLGMAWRLTYNLQFDINGGLGLNTHAHDYYTGMGMSYRF